MKPSLQTDRSRSVRAKGFTLLAILLVLAALTLLVGIAIQRGLDEQRSASIVRNDMAAQAIAEVGLERTRAYLSGLLARDADLDRALDPGLNTNCSGLLSLALGGVTTDDHLPVFDPASPLGAGTPVTLLSSNRTYLRVPVNLDGVGDPEGAYLVRIDDNDDDGEPQSLYPNTTSNNVGTTTLCTEGVIHAALNKAVNNPVRDRDRTVIVTVIGIAPTINHDTAQARKVLRVRVGPRQASGIVAGGNISVGGSGQVCGEFGNVSTTGNILDGCFCGGAANCCNTTSDNCVIEAAGTCNAFSSGGSQSVCVPGSAVPPPPKVHVWSSFNAPPKCTTPPCTPFYYLRQSSSTAVEVHMWNYSQTSGTANCSEPQACKRLYAPGEVAPDVAPCPSNCWKQVYKSDDVTLRPACATGTAEVFGSDPLAVTPLTPLTALNPSWPLLTTLACDATTKIWTVDATSVANSTAATCDAVETPPRLFPSGSTAWDQVPGQHYTIGKKFNYLSGSVPGMPRGIWFVEGNVDFNTTTPRCASPSEAPPLPIPPGPLDPFILPGVPVPTAWGVSVIALGNIELRGPADIYLAPAHPLGITLMAGRDLKIRNGNTNLRTCFKSAAVMVHEQVDMDANTLIEAQLVTEDKGTCSPLASGNAITMNGNTTIRVPMLPPISAGSQVDILEWTESSY